MLDKYYNKIIKIYVRWKLFGFKLKCPFCDKSFRKFFPAGFSFSVLKEKNVIGGGYRQNALCPYCKSSDRERLIYLYLKKKTDVFRQPVKLLHVAPEKNLQEIFKKSKNIDYISGDIGSSLAMVKMDIVDIKYKDNFFDVIICNHVFEHILDDQKAMAEIFRVLKPGGWAILQVPISSSLSKTYEDSAVVDPKDREVIFGQSDHVRIYGMDYRSRLESTGFKVTVFDAVREFGSAAIKKYALLKGENLYIATKE